MLPGQRLDRRDSLSGVACREQRRHPVLAGHQPPLGQPRRLGRGPGLVSKVGIGLPAPQRQGRVQASAGLRRTPLGQQPAALARQPLELDGIDRVVRTDPQRVAGRGTGQPTGGGAGRAVGLQRAAQVGDERLQRSDGARRRLTVPEVVEQPVDRHHVAARDQQPGQDGALAGSAQLERA